MPSASSSAAMASAWSAGSIGASSVPSAPSQSKATTQCSRGSSARSGADLRLPPAGFGESPCSRRHGGVRRCRRRRTPPAARDRRGFRSAGVTRWRPAWRSASSTAHFAALGRERGRREGSPCQVAAWASASSVAPVSWACSWAAGALAKLMAGIRSDGAIEPASRGAHAAAGQRVHVATIFRPARGPVAGIGTFASTRPDARRVGLPRLQRACPSAGLDGWPQSASARPRLSIASSAYSDLLFRSRLGATLLSRANTLCP